MKIKLFSHAVSLDGNTQITKGQTDLIIGTGLADVAEINMMLHFKEEPFLWMKDKLPNANYKVFDSSYGQWFEGTTMLHIQELVHSTDEEFYVCYIHHKGLTSNLHDWRTYMEYWNIVKWKDCVTKLDEGYDTCGASFLNDPPHPFYAGNFLWARASYLRRCKRLKTPPENNLQPQFSGQPHHRFDYECWHGSGNPKAYDLHPGPKNRWYWRPEMYQK